MPNNLRKITVNLPADLLNQALEKTGTGITPTLIEALTELNRRHGRSALRKLRGKVRIEIDLERTRR
jgi:hypothetical protein